MEDEKTQHPTARKLKEAKERGDGPSSHDLANALFFGGSLALLFVGFPYVTNAFKDALRSTLEMPPSHDFKIPMQSYLEVIWSSLLLLGGITLIGLVVQIGLKGFYWKSPSRHYKWSLKGLFEEKRKLPFLLLKGVIFCAGVYFLGPQVLHLLDKLPFLSLGSALFEFKREVFVFLVILWLGWFIEGIIERLFEQWLFQKRQKMTKQELKEERRETEGNPWIKREMRKKR